MAFNVPVLGDRPQTACPKPQPHVLAKAEKDQTKAQREKAFRDAVWARDKGRSRASGQSLLRGGINWKRRGEVHHCIPRSVEPHNKFDPSRGILLSREEHAMAETCCPGDPAKCLLDIDGPSDLSQPQLFIWRDVLGAAMKVRQG